MSDHVTCLMVKHWTPTKGLRVRSIADPLKFTKRSYYLDFSQEISFRKSVNQGYTLYATEHGLSNKVVAPVSCTIGHTNLICNIALP